MADHDSDQLAWHGGTPLKLSLFNPTIDFSPSVVVPAALHAPNVAAEQATVMEVLQRFGPEFLSASGTASVFQRQTLAKILGCRGGVHGWHLFRCGQCGHLHYAANRCAGRHCPDCTRSKCGIWLEQVIGWCLPINYLHLVFTLPHSLNRLIAHNLQLLNLLMTTVRKQLTDIARKVYGCKAGFLIVLHTWGQAMEPHFHCHILLTSGGLSLDGTKWISMSENDAAFNRYQLARDFRKMYLQGLIDQFNAGKLTLPHGMSHVATESDLRDWLRCCYRHSWVCHANGAPPGYEGPGAALKYLAAYAMASVIKDARIVSITDTHVTISKKEYRRGGEVCIETMTGMDFMRRFTQHFLPQSVTRLRYCGLFHGRNRAARLDQCRAVLRRQGLIREDQLTTPPPPEKPRLDMQCPSCGFAAMQNVGFFWWEQLEAYLDDYRRARERCTSRFDTSHLDALRYLVSDPMESPRKLSHDDATITIVADGGSVSSTVIATPLGYDLHGPSP